LYYYLLKIRNITLIKEKKKKKKTRNLLVEGSEALDIGGFARDVVELDTFSCCHDWRGYD
jgi:hypothetical protein